MSASTFDRSRTPARPGALPRLLAGERSAPLEPQVRAYMESRFAQDFSAVRVHADRRAADLAALMRARAFAVDSRVVFGRGAYRPGTEAGDALIGHELVHVAQRRAAATVGREVGRRGSELERAAEGAAHVPPGTTVAGSTAALATPVPVVQRYEAAEHVIAGEAGPAAVSRAAGLLSQAELELRAGRSAWRELVLLRDLWERNGGDPEALTLLEEATYAIDENNYRAALAKVEQATPLVIRWLREHPETGAGVSTTVAGREHPEVPQLLAEAGEPPALTLRDSGVTLTYSEVVALGDFYPTVESMHRAPRSELVNADGTGLLDLIRREVSARDHVNFNVAYQRATQWRDVVRYDRLGRRLGTEGELVLGAERAVAPGGDPTRRLGLSYTELAKTDLHFARENESTWTAGHEAAVALAERARGETDRARRQALTNDAHLRNALADHFLTDAIAAGHLLNKSHFRTLAAAFVRGNRDRIRDAVASSLVRDHPGTIYELVSWKVQRAPVISSIPVFGFLIGVVVGALAGLAALLLPGVVENMVKSTIRDVERTQPNLFEDIGSKVAHDHYNREGVVVTNRRGDRWRTFGDDNLRRSSATWQLLSLAVLRSRADIAETLRGRRPGNLLAAWEYVPIPPTGFDELALRTASDLMLRPRGNPVADLMAANIGMLKVQTEFEESEEERRREARSKEERVERYLRNIRRRGRIEDELDSDDVARDIVARPAVYRTLTLPEKAILVQEMLTGETYDADERAILEVLRDVRRRGELRFLLRAVPAPRLRSKFDGEEARQLEQILAETQ